MPSLRSKAVQSRKRRFSEDSPPDDSDGPPPLKRVARQTRNDDIRKRSDPASADPRAAVTEASSQMVLEAFQRARRHKKDDFVVKLRSKARQQRADMEAVVADTNNQLLDEDTAFKGALSKEIAVALELPQLHGQDNGNNKSLSQNHPLREATLSLLKLSHRLIARYEHAAKMVQAAAPQTKLGLGWEVDRDKVADLLLLGYSVAERQINGIISNDSEPHDSSILSAQVDKENMEALAHYGFKIDHSTSGVGLNKVLGRAEKYMRRIADILPREES